MAEATSACRLLGTRTLRPEYESIQQLQLLMVDIDNKNGKAYNRFSDGGDGSLNMEQLWGDQSHGFENEAGELDDLDDINNSGKAFLEEQSAPINSNVPTEETNSTKESEITSVVKQHPAFQTLIRAHYSCRKV